MAFDELLQRYQDERDDIGAICLYDPNFGGTPADINITIFFYNREESETQQVNLGAETVRLMTTIENDFVKGYGVNAEVMATRIRKVIISPSSKIHWSEAYNRGTGIISVPTAGQSAWPSIAATEERPFF
jgi:hypothetical protein